MDHFREVVGHLNARIPGEFECKAGIQGLEKASLMISADRDGRNPRFLIDATATNARVADTSWERPIEVDFRRYGIQTPWSA